ncbi:YgdI/YgdR family lipoprotein [Mucilaginibacter myungsuensis]|uniref:Uncharacterized protein n=1 Tax=Mucilaginibacter myungsuensis TaxID=649104 RepID=A0A929KZ47_9SPHI|nr:hypothetical protein [Mucilaginibacter myungsuensis]MBE9664361.1 hypothetical protein [Mucilaginibacter myungsuensis]MDN3597071.1 hypothetical protein [Mucilaginibacter myungsuensis]
MKYLIAILLALSTFTAVAQTDDYVITTNGDTIKCEVSVTWSLKYKVPGGKSEKIKTETIKEFYQQSNDILFRALDINDNGKPEFIHVIQNGPISLYQRVGNNYAGAIGTLLTSLNWYVNKDNGKPFNIKGGVLISTGTTSKAKDGFGELLKDQPEIYNKYTAIDKLSFNKILDLVSLYNTGQPYKPKVIKRDTEADMNKWY